MKIAFSALGCPNYSWTDICAMAKDLGFQGIEVRQIESENVRSPFAPERCAATGEQLRSRNIAVPCLSTGCCLQFVEKSAENL